MKPAPTYHFTADRLTEMQGGGRGKFYDWPVHMAEKTWVDVTAFNEAFVKALELHKGKYKPSVDPELLKASLAEAHREAARR